MGLDGNNLIEYAYILSKVGKVSQAESMLDQAEGIGHSERYLLLTKATILFERGEIEEAFKQNQLAIEEDPEYADAHALLAHIYFLKNEIGKTEDEAKQAIKYDSFNSYAYTNLAFAYEAQGNVEAAIKAAEESNRINSSTSLVHYILGVCYLDNDMETAAVSEFNKFLSLYQDSVLMREYKTIAEEYLASLEPVSE
jgi:tetratricopeptide (TPR) repeat protein